VSIVLDAAVKVWDPLSHFNGNFLTDVPDIPQPSLQGCLFVLAHLLIGATCVTSAVIIMWVDAFRVMFAVHRDNWGS